MLRLFPELNQNSSPRMPFDVSYAYWNESARTDESDLRVSAVASGPECGKTPAAATAMTAKKAIACQYKITQIKIS